MPAGKDKEDNKPIHYIKKVPVPIPSHIGKKIQTRSITHYRATTPSQERRSSLLVTPFPKESTSNDDIQSIDSGLDDGEMTPGMLNYYRRLDQQLSQGYNAPKNRPYQGIGDPFFLEEKELILHSLGQWDPNQQAETDHSDEDDVIDTISSIKQNKQAGSSAKMMFSKSRKDLNTLSKEIAHGRNMIRNVKLGHGLFDLIKHERDAKKIAAEEQDKKKMLAMRNQWQPPKENSSSDEESEEDLDQDVDLAGDGEMSEVSDIWRNVALLKGYMQTNGKETDEEIEEVKTFITEDIVDDDAEIKDKEHEIDAMRPLTAPGRKKKKQKQPRPYTPLHNSIVERKEFTTAMSQQREVAEPSESPKDNPAAQALFRQLCALHWLIKAMNEETTTNITPIRSCWKYKEIGGSKVSNEHLSDEKEVSRRWREFSSAKLAEKSRFSIAGQSATFVSKLNTTQQAKKGFNRFNTRAGGKKLWSTGMQRNSTVISSNTHLGLSSLGVPRQSFGIGMDQSVSDDTPISTSRQDIEEEEDEFKGLMNRYLDVVEKKDDEDKALDSYNEKPDSQMSSFHEKRKKEKRFTDNETKTPRKSPRKSIDATKNAELEARLNFNFDKYDEDEKRSSKLYRADTHIRPKSSPALIQFQLNRISIKKGNLLNEMNNKFRELQDDGALTLHDRFEQKDRLRLEVCQNKFLAINQSTERSGFYRALDQMRRRTNQLLSRPTEEQLKKKQTEIKGNWYTELEDGIPPELLKEWNFRNIRDKLRFYGLVEHGRQLYSEHKFIKVLEKLQKWEICSPDIAAAVEFCREKIVGMPEEKFERWFQLQFPDIQRPVTAPPMRQEEKDTKSIKDGESERSVTRQSSRSSRVQWANRRQPRPISIR